MTAATMSGHLARSSYVRVRALPSHTQRRNAPEVVAVSRPSTLASTAGTAAVSRAFANHSAAARVAAKPKKHEAVEFRLIYTIAFAVFLFTSVIERAMPHKWAHRAGDNEIKKSVFEQAREAAHISAAYAFMG